MADTEIGNIEKAIYNEARVEWRIPDFFSAVTKMSTSYKSPTFFDADMELCLKLCTKENFPPNVIFLYLCHKGKKVHSLQHNFALKRSDGGVESLTGGIPGVLATYDNSITLPVLQQRCTELAPCNVVTVLCTLKLEVCQPTCSTISDKAKSSQLIELDRLSENFKDLFDDKGTCDTTLKVKDKEYKAHRAVLIARSTVFSAMFKDDASQKETGIVTIPDCDPESFQEFLEYLYCGKLENITMCSALNLYSTSDKYDVLELKAFCVEHLMNCFTVNNICDIAVFADKYDEMELFCAIQEFFNRNACTILETSEWNHLVKNNYYMANKLLKEMVKVYQEK